MEIYIFYVKTANLRRYGSVDQEAIEFVCIQRMPLFLCVYVCVPFLEIVEGFAM